MRFVRNEAELQMVDDTIHHGEIGEESDDAHLATAFGADHRVYLKDLADHLSPAFGRAESERLPR